MDFSESMLTANETVVRGGGDCGCASCGDIGCNMGVPAYFTGTVLDLLIGWKNTVSPLAIMQHSAL